MEKTLDPGPGAVLGGDYVLGPFLAQGGMGRVYEARQLSTGALRAVKVMQGGIIADSKARERFEQEARVASKIASDHVVQVVGAGVDESGVPWIAMELLDGEDLAEWIQREGAMELSSVRTLCGQLFHALAAAHAVGIVHRDLKAENVFLARSRTVGVPFLVKVLDFGVAKFLIDEHHTATVAVGTPIAMAPEQSDSPAVITPATDVWALGLLLFRVLSGKHYWLAAQHKPTSVAALWKELLVEPIQPPSQRVSVVGGRSFDLPGFDGWFARCLDRDPKRRFSSASDAYSELEAVFAGMLGAANGEQASPQFRSTTKPNVDSSTAEAKTSIARPGVNTPNLAAKVSVQLKRGTTTLLFEGRTGERLLNILHRNGPLLDAVCGGQGLCSTCRVAILDGSEHASERSASETELARQRGWAPAVRLACQVEVRGAMVVRGLLLSAGVSATQRGERASLPKSERMAVLDVRLVGFNRFLQTQLAYDALHVLEQFSIALMEPALAIGGVLLELLPDGLRMGFRGLENDAAAVRAALRAAFRMRSRMGTLNSFAQRGFNATFALAAGIDVGVVISGPFFVDPPLGNVTLGVPVQCAAECARSSERRGGGIVATGSVLALLGDELRLKERFETSVGEGVEVENFLRPDVSAMVQETFEQVAARSEEFSDAFYRRFLASDPGVRAQFAHTDMLTQRAMLMSVLARAVRGLDQQDALEKDLRELGRRHKRLGVSRTQFKLLGNALIDTLAEMLGDSFGAEQQLAWMELYSILVRAMVDGGQDFTT